jgi:hypothetical protein
VGSALFGIAVYYCGSNLLLIFTLLTIQALGLAVILGLNGIWLFVSHYIYRTAQAKAVCVLVFSSFYHDS